MEDLVQLEKPGRGIALLRLNRPQAANALSKELLAALRDELMNVKRDADTYVLVIAAAGGKVFSAGADLKERAGMSEEEVIVAVNGIKETVNRIAELPQPVIAAMNGSALGGGLELALACDLRIGANDRKYGLPETTLAIIPGAGGTQRLARLIGPGKAKALIYSGQLLSGQEALNDGILEYSTSLEAVEQEAMALAEKIASNGPIALQQAKKAIDEGLDTSLSTGLDIETGAYKRTVPTADRLEGIRAFQEKRAPDYHGE
ncbi:enoyl-CoA hydratase-related protein [Natribacillus halophilus]|uniref:Enoyl-CoA hydratase/carnithine racemase n=1 Tax=Natribacillus halophilus TaxID=549003 RepID=A0A1G8NUS6_9BACI|nr:enoyl-CoA hydratase-related protein [Natribacillus halophilus]SDI84021.1 Enoyl-CoA hydratase/carnithine racemase [Natribacillus halophilus]